MKAEEKQTKQNQKQKQRGHRIITLAATIRKQNQGEIASDIMGSYTGTDVNGEHPEQDADDL